MIRPTAATVTGLGIMVMALVAGSISCSGPPELSSEGPYWVDDDRRGIPEPEYYEPELIWTSIKRTAFDQAEEAADLERNFRKLFGAPEQACNINSYDEVPNSSWFTNRHGLQRMAPRELAVGRNETGGPDTTGPWTVFRPKVGGATPGFWIEDSRGYQYIIKFDPIGNAEMATAAGAMGSRFFHGCGYNVPEESIVYWQPEMLRIRDGATIRDEAGIKLPFVQADLDNILQQINHGQDGRIRSLASLSLGNVKGPFSYDGLRKDDANDRFPHQDRRELRGLYVIASFINHYDTKDHNSLDVYEGEDGAGYLRHYLIDFGSTFGSDGQMAKPHIKGYANTVDLKQGALSLVSLGMVVWPWEHATKDPLPPSIGYFESANFHPNKFEPIIPNPAFEKRTDRDAYWGARIVMAWRDDDLRALIKSGQFSDTAAEQYLLQTLIERRDKIGRYWFGKVNPLDHFELDHTGDVLTIDFDDLAIVYGLETSAAIYDCQVSNDRGVIFKRQFSTSRISLSESDLPAMSDQDGNDTDSDRYYRLDIRTERPGVGRSKPTRLWLKYDDQQDKYSLAKIEHLD